MAQWVKTLGAESGDLGLTLGVYIEVEGEKRFPHVCGLTCSHTTLPWGVCSLTHTKKGFIKR